MHDELLRVGELARRSGVSVRTLHHYDAIGLLTPSFTTGAGHRQYTADDALRLSQVRALATLGFTLEEIAALLDSPNQAPLDALVRLQVRAEEHLAETRALVDRLTHLTDTLRAKRTPALDDLLDTITTMNQFEAHFEKYYTPEQLEALAQRRAAVGEEGMRQAQDDWSQLYADAQAAAEQGLHPGGPEGRDLARRKRALIEAFTGGDAGIEDSLRRMYAENPDLRQAVAGPEDGMGFLRAAEQAFEGE